MVIPHSVLYVYVFFFLLSCSFFSSSFLSFIFTTNNKFESWLQQLLSASRIPYYVIILRFAFSSSVFFSLPSLFIFFELNALTKLRSLVRCGGGGGTRKAIRRKDASHVSTVYNVGPSRPVVVVFSVSVFIFFFRYFSFYFIFFNFIIRFRNNVLRAQEVRNTALYF